MRIYYRGRWSGNYYNRISKKRAIEQEKQWARDTLVTLEQWLSGPPNEREWVSPRWDASSGIDCMHGRLAAA
ncbi:MAG: hypothetical protein GY757_53720 [bacterium]|nr:hypothetical protein [bacterium]